MNPTPEQGAVIKQAAEWHQRLQSGELDQESRRKLRAWLLVPGHLEELARICLLDALLQGPVKKGARHELPKNVINFYARAGITPPGPRQPQRAAATSRFNVKKLAAVASVAFATIAALWMSWSGTETTLTTASGHWRKQLLDDGTVVYAAPNTKLSFQFTKEVRGVRLFRGEALFEVAKLPSRPFIVNTDAGTVRAVGTAFSTADLGDTVVVNVAEGKVAVTATAGRDGIQPMVHATANQQVVLSPTGVSTPVSVDVDHELMWVRDWYEYEGDRLGDIVAQLNALNDAQVIVEDPQVLRLRVNRLAFKPSQPGEFVRKINLWYADYPGRTGANALRLQS